MYTDEQIISIFFTEKGNLRRYKKYQKIIKNQNHIFYKDIMIVIL